MSNSTELSKYTVIGIDPESGQIIRHHVKAKSNSEAFYIVAKVSSVDLVAAFDGWISEGSGVEFAGSAIVDSETVLSQSDVFSGAEVDDFYVDDEYTPDQYWVDMGAGVCNSEYSIENQTKAEHAYMVSGGRKNCQ